MELESTVGVPKYHWKSDQNHTLNGPTYQEMVLLVIKKISYEQLVLFLQRRELRKTNKIIWSEFREGVPIKTVLSLVLDQMQALSLLG